MTRPATATPPRRLSAAATGWPAVRADQRLSAYSPMSKTQPGPRHRISPTGNDDD